MNDIKSNTRGMSRKERLGYIFAYYWLHIFGAVFAVFFIIYFLTHFLFGIKENWIYVTFTNVLTSDEGVNALRDDFIEYTGYDLKEKNVVFNANSYFDATTVQGTNNSYFQAFVAMIEAGDLDAVIGTKDNIAAVGASGRLKDLSSEEMRELFASYSDRFVYCTPIDEEYSEDEVPVGIDISDSSIAGEYTITPSGAEAVNYDISYVEGKLTVGTKTADLSGEISKENGNSENPSQSNESGSDVNSLVFTAATRAVRLLGDGQDSDTPEKSTLTVTIVGDLTYVYDGKAHTPNVEVKDGEDSLIQGEDFNVVYDKNVDAGTATVTVSWIDSGKYTEFDPVTKEFTITPKPITVTWTDVGPFTANGQPQSPKASIDAAELVVPEGSELKDPCTVNVEGAQSAAGNYTATAVFSNSNYMAVEGTGTKTFTINPAPSPETIPIIV